MQNYELPDELMKVLHTKLMENKVKNLFEVQEIARTTKYGPHSVLLDVGSGLGHQLNLFNKMENLEFKSKKVGMQ